MEIHCAFSPTMCAGVTANTSKQLQYAKIILASIVSILRVLVKFRIQGLGCCNAILITAILSRCGQCDNLRTSNLWHTTKCHCMSEVMKGQPDRSNLVRRGICDRKNVLYSILHHLALKVSM